MEWMILPLRRYAQFRGRSRRKEYWMFVLFQILCLVVLGILDTMLGLGGSGELDRSGSLAGANPAFGMAGRFTGGVLSMLFSLAMLVPSLAVGVRRLHDTGRSGWWLLAPVLCYAGAVASIIAGLAGGSTAVAAVGAVLGIAAAVGVIALLIFFCLDGTSGPNRFGDDPKNPVGDIGEVFR